MRNILTTITCQFVLVIPHRQTLVMRNELCCRFFIEAIIVMIIIIIILVNLNFINNTALMYLMSVGVLKLLTVATKAHCKYHLSVFHTHARTSAHTHTQHKHEHTYVCTYTFTFAHIQADSLTHTHLTCTKIASDIC